MTVEIHLGCPRGFKRLWWYSDYRRFDVALKHLFSPSSHWQGVLFSAPGRVKSVVFSPGAEPEEVSRAFLEVEAEFGIPQSAGKYGTRER